MMKTYWIWIGIMVIIVAGAWLVYGLMRPLESVAGQRADYVMQAEQLAEEYSGNEEAANKKYLGKILRVSGEIHEIEGGTPLTVVLKGTDMTMVRVELKDSPQQMPSEGDKVEVIGSCSGFLLDVVLNNAAIQ